MKYSFEQKVYMVPSADTKPGFELSLIPKHKTWWMSPEDIMLKEVEIEIDLDIPSKNELILLAIASMEDKQKQIIADARLESAKIQTKINQLMCIEHQT